MQTQFFSKVVNKQVKKLINHVQFQYQCTSHPSEIESLNNDEVIVLCLIQDFEADFPQKVSLKVLNSCIILKTVTDLFMSSVHKVRDSGGSCCTS